MAVADETLRALVEELADALQVGVLLAQHLEAGSMTMTQDVAALSRNLQRAVRALEKLRAESGVG